jgi:hypothetical protein
VGPRAGLDIVANRKILPFWESNPGHPAHSLVSIQSICTAEIIIFICYTFLINHKLHFYGLEIHESFLTL